MADEMAPIGSLGSALARFRAHGPIADPGGIDPSGDTVNGCGVCRYGLVSVRHPGTQSAVYACLCQRGQAKRIASITSQITEAEREQYWPGGVPQAVDPQRVLELLTAARIPPKFLPWSLASYRERFKSDREQQRYLKLAEEWIQASERSDLVIFGPNGTGKTGIAIALVRALAEQQQRSEFWTMRELSIAWRDTFRAGARDDDGALTEADFLASLVALDLLIVDEVSGQRLSEFVEDTLTMIVDKRQRLQKPTILTMNTPAEAEDDGAVLAQLLGPTLQDRLRERGQFWPMKGLSRRNTYSRQPEQSR